MVGIQLRDCCYYTVAVSHPLLSRVICRNHRYGRNAAALILSASHLSFSVVWWCPDHQIRLSKITSFSNTDLSEESMNTSALPRSTVVVLFYSQEDSNLPGLGPDRRS